MIGYSGFGAERSNSPGNGTRRSRDQSDVTRWDFELIDDTGSSQCGNRRADCAYGSYRGILLQRGEFGLTVRCIGSSGSTLDMNGFYAVMSV